MTSLKKWAYKNFVSLFVLSILILGIGGGFGMTYAYENRENKCMVSISDSMSRTAKMMRECEEYKVSLRAKHSMEQSQ